MTNELIVLNILAFFYFIKFTSFDYRNWNVQVHIFLLMRHLSIHLPKIYRFHSESNSLWYVFVLCYHFILNGKQISSSVNFPTFDNHRNLQKTIVKRIQGKSSTYNFTIKSKNNKLTTFHLMYQNEGQQKKYKQTPQHRLVSTHYS